MNARLIERLLCVLDVRLEALALCAVDRGTRLRLPPMDSVVVHYVLRGRGILYTDEAGPIRFAPDMLLFVPQSTDHMIFDEGDENAPVQAWQDVAGPIGDGLMRFAGSDGDAPIVTACGAIQADCEGVDPFQGFREPLVEDLSSEPAVANAFALIAAEFGQPRFGTRPLTEALMKQCLILAVRAQVERGDLRLLSLIGAHDPRLTKALLAMLEDPARDHSLEELASRSGMSRSLFAERFAEAFDRPPMDLLRQIRLHRAANLLRTTRLPVQVIALTVGYASRSYFSRAFRAAYGEDPKSFRERARSGSERVGSMRSVPDRRSEPHK